MAFNTTVLANQLIQIDLEMQDGPITDEAQQRIETRCRKMAQAIETYIRAIQVQTQVAPGILVSTTGSPTAQTGTTTSAGSGTGSLV